MSLNEKYTWNDFLKENPEFKEKKIKRTSSEGKKAFEAAFKTKVKELLKTRLDWIEKESKRAVERKEGLKGKIKVAKRGALKARVQKKIGKTEKYLHNLTKQTERTKTLQKSI